MFTTQTKKALCLSLLMSLTTSVSAEGWMETLKSWITPKTVVTTAIAALVGTGLYQHHQYKRVPVRGLRIQTQTDDQTFDVNSFDFTAPNWTVQNGIVRGQISINSQSNSGSIDISDTPSWDNKICNFKCKYALAQVNQETPEQESRTVEFTEYDIMPFSSKRTTRNIQNSPLAEHLYGLFSENSHKTRCAQALATTIGRVDTVLDSKNSEIEGLYSQRTALLRKHSRVMESLAPQQ